MRGNEDFFYGNPYITTLTEKIWHKQIFLGERDAIWLILFYAAWCPACVNYKEKFAKF